MILKIVGAFWMIAPFLVFLVPTNNAGELLPYAAFSFICGFLLYRAAPKVKKTSNNTERIKEVNNNTENVRNASSNYDRKSKSEDHKRFLPKSPKLAEFQSDYSESIKLMETIGSSRSENIANGDIYNSIRNGKNNSGETSRILTESYFGIGYNANDEIDSMENLISFRAASYSLLNIELDEKIIKKMAIDYGDNFPTVILALSYLEIYNNLSEKEFFDNNYPLIYTIIEEEHIKVTKRIGRVPVVSQTSIEELKKVLYLISGIKKNNVENNKIREDKSKTKKMLRQTFQDAVIEFIDNLEEKPVKGTSRGNFIELMIHSEAEKYKAELVDMKDDTGLTDEDIEEIIYTAKINIKNEMFPDKNKSGELYQRIVELKDDLYDLDASENSDEDSLPF